MADHLETLQPGAPVYEPYAPTKYGVVLERGISRNGSHETVVYKIRWKDGRESWHHWFHINSYDALLEKTEKKLATHRKWIAKAKELA